MMSGLLLLSMVLSHAVRAETPEEAIARDLPGWTVYGSAVTGDLNGDKIPDFAVIVEKSAPEAPSQKTAMLAVFLGSKGGGFMPTTRAPKAICVGCGGAKAPMDEPLGELEITNKGILNILYSGGSRETWDILVKWRWDQAQKKFIMIGETDSRQDSIGELPPEVLDVNYSTLKAEKSVGKKKKTCKVPPRLKGVTLEDYEFEDKHFEQVQAIEKSCR